MQHRHGLDIQLKRHFRHTLYGTETAKQQAMAIHLATVVFYPPGFHHRPMAELPERRKRSDPEQIECDRFTFCESMNADPQMTSCYLFVFLRLLSAPSPASPAAARLNVNGSGAGV